MAVSISLTGISPLHGSHVALPIACDASNARTTAVKEYHYTDIWIMAAELLSLLWNADNSRSFCPSFRSWRISPTAPHISNVSDLPYAASPFYCAAFFIKEQGAVLRYGTEKGKEAFQYRVGYSARKVRIALISLACSRSRISSSTP